MPSCFGPETALELPPGRALPSVQVFVSYHSLTFKQPLAASVVDDDTLSPLPVLRHVIALISCDGNVPA